MRQSFLMGMFREKSAASAFVENFQKLVQVAAIVLGGLWALKEFYNFQERTNALTLEQQKLNVDQARLNAQQADIQREQQKLSVESARLAIRHQELSIALSQRQLKISDDSKFEFDITSVIDELRSYDDGTRLYYATVTLTIQNKSDQPLEITACSLATFFGDLPESEIGLGEAVHTNSPIFGTDARPEGRIKWSRLTSTGMYWRDNASNGRSWLTQSSFGLRPSQLRSGGCAGRPTAGSAHDYSEAIVFRAKPSNWFGYAVNIYSSESSFERWRSRGVYLDSSVEKKTKDTSK
jgi:hypothetical protein